jgi:hypothetical protein
MKRRCSHCKLEKEIAEFGRDRGGLDGFAHKCLECSRMFQRRIYDRNPEYTRDKEFRRRYGIDVDTYERMYGEQEGYCAICGKHESKQSRRLSIDHNHITGEIRALLCHDCNTVIGFSHESVEILTKAVLYLKRWNGE